MPNECGLCGEELEPPQTYCEDCRESGDLEDVLESALDGQIELE